MELRSELQTADIRLRRKQDFWETPRNLAIVVGSAVAVTAAIAGYLGYQTGRNPPIVVQFPSIIQVQILPAPQGDRP